MSDTRATPTAGISKEAWLIGELRRNAEEWGATSSPVWLERLGESEDDLESFIAGHTLNTRRLAALERFGALDKLCVHSAGVDLRLNDAMLPKWARFRSLAEAADHIIQQEGK